MCKLDDLIGAEGHSVVMRQQREKMLNAELESMNRILIYDPFFSRWARAGLRAMEIASLVDQFVRWLALICAMTNLPMHFAMIRVSTMGWNLLKQGACVCFGIGVIAIVMR